MKACVAVDEAVPEKYTHSVAESQRNMTAHSYDVPGFVPLCRPRGELIFPFNFGILCEKFWPPDA